MKTYELVQLIRIKCNIDQRTLAEWLGINQSMVSFYETGRNKARLLTKHKLIEIANKKAGLKLKLSDITD